MIDGTWVYAPPTWVLDRWVPNFRASGLAQAKLDGMFVIGAPNYHASGPAEVLDACRAVTKLGIAALPGIGHMLDERMGVIGPEAWFDPETWKLTARWVEHLAGEFACRGIVLDVEPYWHHSQAQRYLSMVYRNILMLSDAIQPLIDVLSRLGVTPYVMPGSLMTPYAAVLLPLKPVFLSEESYLVAAADSSVYLQWMLAHHEPADRTIPGFYGGGLRNPEFLRGLRENEIKTAWYFLRADEDEYREFGKESWWNG